MAITLVAQGRQAEVFAQSRIYAERNFCILHAIWPSSADNRTNAAATSQLRSSQHMAATSSKHAYFFKFFFFTWMGLSVDVIT